MLLGKWGEGGGPGQDSVSFTGPSRSAGSIGARARSDSIYGIISRRPGCGAVLVDSLFRIAAAARRHSCDFSLSETQNSPGPSQRFTASTKAAKHPHKPLLQDPSFFLAHVRREVSREA